MFSSQIPILLNSPIEFMIAEDILSVEYKTTPSDLQGKALEKPGGK